MFGVAPFAGAWIEIFPNGKMKGVENVAPFAGAWIEITVELTIEPGVAGRSVRRSVD